MISETTINRILEASNIEDVVSEYIPLERAGARFKCCCPMHTEKTPSFYVTPNRNSYYCFGCHKGGNSVTFLMDVRHMTYREALFHLARKYNIPIEEQEDRRSAEEIQLGKKREAMLIANRMSAEYFASCINADDDRARSALAYAEKRWGKKYVEQEGIGFAPGHGQYIRWAKSKGLSMEILTELGLVRSKNGSDYDGYYDRITIPIKDRTNNVIGFTARAVGDGEPKYINSPESLVYVKGSSVFGINNASRQAAEEELLYLVEGAPDVMRLQSLGVYNTVASLGTAWTQKQFSLLRRYNPRLCFIPDIDPPKPEQKYGTGIESVIKNGLAAMEAGFNVTVKEIESDGKTKIDPDSYFKSKKMLDAVPETDFPLWYAAKLHEESASMAERSTMMRKVAKTIATTDDKLKCDLYTKQLSRMFGIPVSFWQQVVNEVVKGNIEQKKQAGSKMLDKELYQKYGFYERNHCYYALGKNCADEEWSNFSMTPLFHIKDQLNPKRLFKLTNVEGHEDIIEMKQEDLVSLQRFKLRTEGQGNFIWKAKEEQLTKLKGFLYEKTETAVEITQLGWQKDEFFAFGNGVYYNNQWVPVDEYGIVRLGEPGNFYLPASSRIYRTERKLFQFERRFVHTNLSAISLRRYTDQMIAVFGNNAKVGICFMLATLFKDVVTGITKNFPILNLFGPKGSGKSELGHSLMSFFIIKNDPPNLSTSTEATLADTVGQCANALVHIDEYKNTIELSRREFIKGLYDGVGRTRMNMDRDKKRETTNVDCGIILSGQEMPTIDIAIFSRLLFCTFSKSEFSTEAKKRFDELKEMRDLGCSHMVLELLRHRKKFEAGFSNNYKEALSDIMSKVEKEGVEDRILRNWTIPLAAFRTLYGVIDLSFDYKEMLQICVDGILKQNSECRSTNEIASFWQVVDFLHQNGDVFIDADYRIKYEREFKGKGMAEKIVFRNEKPVLYLCTKRVMMLYKKNGKMVGDSTLPTESLRFYLENSKEYLGTKNAVRFKNFVNTAESVKSVDSPSGMKKLEKTSRTDWALCFDYEMLAANYSINLEVEIDRDDEPDPVDIDTDDKQLPY